MKDAYGSLTNDSNMAGNNLYEQRLTAGSLDAPYEPDARYSHSMSLVSDTGKWIMYGGYLKDGKYLYVQLNPSVIEEFNVATRRWKQHIINGRPPLAAVGVATASIGCNIYCFGGSNSHGQWFNTLYCLDTMFNTSSQLMPQNGRLSPMAKHRAVMITYGSMLVIYGGYGPLPSIRYPNVQYDEHQVYKGLCWTNELVCYDIEQSKY